MNQCPLGRIGGGAVGLRIGGVRTAGGRRRGESLLRLSVRQLLRHGLPAVARAKAARYREHKDRTRAPEPQPGPGRPDEQGDGDADREGTRQGVLPEELVLFPRESLAPDAPPLFRILLAQPTLANARRYVRWHARRTAELQVVQALIQQAGKELEANSGLVVAAAGES